MKVSPAAWVEKGWKQDTPCSFIVVLALLVIAAFSSLNMCFCHGSLPGYPARTGTEPLKHLLLCCLAAACITMSPAGKLGRQGVLFSWAWNKGELAETWHNAVTHLVSAFKRLSFPSPSKYVKEVSLYITNHGLNFKVLDKNDLTLHL